jgi:Zn-dependent protease
MVLLAMVLGVLPVSVESQSVVYLIYTNDILGQFSMANSTNVVMVGNTDQIVMQDPLLVVGGGIDSYERRGLDKTLEYNYFPADRVVDDGQTTYEGRNLTDFDLILIGGPEHNAYAKYLCDLGVLSYNVTDKKMPAMVLEVESTSPGHKVLCVGDVSVYVFHRKDLPLNNIIPEQYAPAAAVATGATLGVAAIGVEKLFSSLARVINKLWNSVVNYLPSHAFELYGDKEASIRKIKVREEKVAARKKVFLGLNSMELAFAVLASFVFGFAYLFAARAPLDLADIFIYLRAGGIALVAHDLGHRIVAARYQLKTEYQFWGYGMLVILITSWLFGAVFAQPARTIIEGDDKKAPAFAFFIGPIVSLGLAFVFVVLVPFGGALSTIGGLGFTMDPVNGLYMLMPFYPMDGKRVVEWGWKYWGIIFIPLLIFYVIVTVMFL